MAASRPDADWEAAWHPLIARVGEQLDDDIRWGPDMVEAGMIRRYLEPLELACELHTDAEVARRHGYPDIVAPYTSVWAHVMPTWWSPGETLYATDDRDAQPISNHTLGDDMFDGAPVTRAMVGTSVSMEFVRPLSVGERAGAGPRRLTACIPKQTRLGRGAFVTFDRHVFVESGERIGTVSVEVFLFDPWEAAEAGALDE